MKERCRKIYEIICGAKKLSIRQISRMTNIPKSSTQRHKKRIEKRNIFPESHLWETEEGQKFIHRLVIVTIMIFGVMCGVGAGKISFFFKLIRIFTHVGISESTIRNIANEIENQLIEFQKRHEGAVNPEKPLEVIVGADETFFDEIILVLMELASGYIFIEEEASDRTYATWMEKVQDVINKMGLRIKYVVSDRAKALIKLALKGIKCISVPDLFHASNEIVKLLGLNLSRKLSSIQSKIEKASAALSMMITLSQGTDEIRIQVIVHLLPVKDGRRRFYYWEIVREGCGLPLLYEDIASTRNSRGFRFCSQHVLVTVSKRPVTNAPLSLLFPKQIFRH